MFIFGEPMADTEKPFIGSKAPENLIIYDPDNLPYEKLHLCIYMRELLDDAEKASEDLNPREQG
jgi:hypothetical protein